MLIFSSHFFSFGYMYELVALSWYARVDNEHNAGLVGMADVTSLSQASFIA